MEDKKVIKNEKQEIHKISKELEERMAYECMNIHKVEDTENKNNRR